MAEEEEEENQRSIFDRFDDNQEKRKIKRTNYSSFSFKYSITNFSASSNASG